MATTRTRTLAGIAALLVTTCVRAQNLGGYNDVTSMPDSPAGQRMTNLIETINAADTEAARRYIEQEVAPAMRDAFPMEEHLAVFAEAYLMSRGFDFHSTRYYDPPRPGHELVAIVRNRLTGAWEGIIMQVDLEPPHLVTGLNFAPAPPRDVPAPPMLEEQQLVAELEVFADRLSRFEAFSGTMLLARDGAVLSLGAWGEASKRFGVPNEVDTKFNLGSMNKMFTAVSIARLVEDGELSFDDPVSRYLGPDWLPTEVTGQMTIGHLLSHTSGLGSYFNDEFFRASRERFRSVDDYRPLVADERPAFAPGTAERYSNTGYLLLGAIIESVSGKSYHDVVRETVYEPVAMIHTDCYAMDQPVPNLAIGYTRRLGTDAKLHWRNNIFRHVIRGGPAGGGYSTVEDLFRFAEAMRRNVIINAETKHALWSPKPSSPAYGYGFSILDAGGDTIVGHGGGFPGISAQLDIYRRSGYTVVVLSNYDRGAQLMIQKTRELISRAVSSATGSGP